MTWNEAFIFRNVCLKVHCFFDHLGLPSVRSTTSIWSHQLDNWIPQWIMWKVKVSAVVLLLLVFVLEAESRRSRRSRSRPPCRPRACQVSSWSEWGPCSHQCGASGKQKRIRKITVVATCGGSCPFARWLSQIRSCNRVKCQNSGTPTGSSLSCVSGYNGMC